MEGRVVEQRYIQWKIVEQMGLEGKVVELRGIIGKVVECRAKGSGGKVVMVVRGVKITKKPFLTLT